MEKDCKIYTVMGLYNSSLRDKFIKDFIKFIPEGNKTIVMDFETPFPTLDFVLNCEKYVPKLKTKEQNIALTGIGACLNAERRNCLENDNFRLFLQKKNENLFFLSGIYNLEEFEAANREEIESIIDVASKNFDIVIISANSFISNIFTYTAITKSTDVLLISDNNYQTARANIECINEFNKFHKQDVSKFKIVVFETENLLYEVILKLYVGFNLLGKVSKRKIFKKEYEEIFNKLGFKFNNRKLFKK